MPHKKFNNHIRNCKAKVSNSCLKIFNSKYRRTRVCPECQEYLRKLKMNVRRFMEMKDEKRTEVMEWEDKNKGTIKVTIEVPVKNEKGEIEGFSKQEITQKTTREEIENGIQVTKETLQTYRNQYAKKELELVSMKDVPEITPEHARIIKLVDEYNNSKNADKLKADLDNLKEKIQDCEDFIRKRDDILESAPKD
jgi:hypothetical protein